MPALRRHRSLNFEESFVARFRREASEWPKPKRPPIRLVVLLIVRRDAAVKGSGGLVASPRQRCEMMDELKSKSAKTT
jgi:hypothetical protein